MISPSSCFAFSCSVHVGSEAKASACHMLSAGGHAGHIRQHLLLMVYYRGLLTPWTLPSSSLKR